MGLSYPFDGLPAVWAVLFTAAFAITVMMLIWTTLLFARGQRARKRPPPEPEDGTDAFTWAFIVPALNEELTIRDSVSRLLALPVHRRHVVVIDDGSSDATPQTLDEIPDAELTVIRREPPDAQQGKGAALNHAYQQLGELIRVERDRVIVVVVDADGRLHHDAPRYAASHLIDPRVGGVQSLVRIYNRGRLLTWLQDVEFSIYGFLYQAGRTGWGTAGMGGNGQFNRLTALDAVADHLGPWRDRLTEDQDLGLRMIAEGWQGRQELRAIVDQQGLSALRPLVRQRTRWSQGNLQAIGLAGVVLRARVPLIARFEQLAYLLMPLWQTIVGVSLVAAIALLITGEARLWDGAAWTQAAFFYLLGFGGVMLGCMARGAPQGAGGVLRGVLIAQVYAFYSWILWPVLIRSTIRQLTDRRSWAKTAREQPTSSEVTGPAP